MVVDRWRTDEPGAWHCFAYDSEHLRKVVRDP